ncbi:auxin response factor 3-like [Forsythia ovata]|uniref:Auxin response factor n=1 Tax=Forsythia ovata TaxID=205694 RepID=A0ABD1S3A6_9LAMI
MMCGLIDLNTANNEVETELLYNSPASSAISGNSELTMTSSEMAASVSMELWHACAGPLISLPKKGTAVVYFPQGHLERLSEHPAVAYDFPPHVFCRVVDVKLHADAVSDEVYAQISLVKDNQIEKKWRDGEVEADAEDEDTEGARTSMIPHMFCKTLTASDTSTHGGFSVPRRAAEDCFTPLDYKQQRPSQELVAKDLHGIEWKFRHIYRGQPRRHLLTTGWSAFVNKKKLVSGDAVLFLRGGDGELRLGIRRAAQVKCGASIPAFLGQQFSASCVASVLNAISTRSIFNICYNPRASSSKIIVPYHKFSKSVAQYFSAGMRFKMRVETEDASERSGLILGVGDVDPVRWPGSKWRCLLVRYDDLQVNHVNRVSPWEIEPSGSVSGPGGFVVPGAKRIRVGFPATKPDFPVLRDGNEVSDFGEPLRFQKVLQGQEILGYSTPYAEVDAPSQHPLEMRCFPGHNGSRTSAVGNSNRHLHADSENSFKGTGTGFGESFQFHKVLQGQEAFSTVPHGRGPTANQVHENGVSNVMNGFQLPTHGNSRSTLTQGCNTHMHPSAALIQASSPSSVLLYQQASSPPPRFQVLHSGNQKKLETRNQDIFYISERFARKLTPCSSSESGDRREDLQGCISTGGSEEHSQLGFLSLPLSTRPSFRGNENFVSMCKSSCRLFGFPLTEGNVATSMGNRPTESACAYGHENTFLACNEGQLYPKPPLATKVMVNSCTKGSDMHAVRDRLLDIAL